MDHLYQISGKWISETQQNYGKLRKFANQNQIDVENRHVFFHILASIAKASLTPSDWLKDWQFTAHRFYLIVSIEQTLFEFCIYMLCMALTLKQMSSTNVFFVSLKLKILGNFNECSRLKGTTFTYSWRKSRTKVSWLIIFS